MRVSIPVCSPMTRNLAHRSRLIRRGVMLVAAVTFAAVVCSPASAQPPDLAGLADSLVAAEQTLHNPSASDAALNEAAGRQQAAYRALGWHPEWNTVVRPRIPQQLLGVYDRNVDARQQLTALLGDEPVKSTVPPWRIIAPAPADALLGYYHEAEAATGVGGNYLAAINLVETTFGRVAGASTADARGPMQFLPSTFAAYGNGGDITSPHDAIMAAGRLLAANGFAGSPDRAIFAYNHSDHYVRAVKDYAAVIGSDPAAFPGYYRWNVYYHTTSGDVLLPIGYAASAPIPVGEYLSAHPQ